MFCEKCGKNLADGERFCGNCGAPVVPRVQQAPVEQPEAACSAQPEYPVQPGYPEQPVDPGQQGYPEQPVPEQYGYAEQPAPEQYGFQQAPVKQRKPVNKKRIGIIAGAAAACIAVFVAIALITGMFKSDQQRMQDVTKKSFHKLLDNYSEWMEKAPTNDLGSFTLDIEPGSALGMISAAKGYNLSWIRDLKLDVATEKQGNKFVAGVGLNLNGVDIGKLNLVVDSEKNQVLLGVDGLSDSLCQLDMGYGGLSSVAQALSGSSTAMLSQIDSEAAVELLEDYFEVIVDALGEVKKSSGSITANGVTGDCTVYTINITQKDVMNIAKLVLEKALDDGDLRDFLESVYSMSMASAGDEGVSFDANYDQMMKSLRESLTNIEMAAGMATDTTLATLTEYVKDDGIVGLRVAVEASQMTGSGFEGFFGIAEDGDSFGVELTVMGQTYLKGSGTKDGDAVTGEIAVMANGSPAIKIKLDHFNAEDRTGAVELSVSSEMLSNMHMDSMAASVLSNAAIRIELDGEKVAFNLLLMGQPALKATLTGGEKKSVAVNTNLPTLQDDDWIDSINVEELRNRLISAGMPEEMLGELFSAIGVRYVDPDDPFVGEDDIDLLVWAPENAVSLTQELCDDFAEQYPDKHISIAVSAVSESDAPTLALVDPDYAADVFAFPSDQLNNLKLANVLSAPTEFSDQIRSRDSAASVSMATVDGELCAYPETGENGYYLAYDKSVVSDADAEKLETVLAACRKAKKKFVIDGGNGYYACMFLFTGGLELNGVDDDGVQQFNAYSEDAVLDSLEAFNKLFTEYADVIEFTDVGRIGSGMEANPSTVAAGIDGTWNAASLKTLLGSSYGAKKLPTVNIKGADTQIVSMNGCKLIGVNSRSDYPNAAQLLANYLAGEKCQLRRAEALGWSPSNQKAAASDTVAANPGSAACLEQAKYAVPQVGIAPTFWSPTGSLGSYLYKTKNASRADLKTQLDKCIEYIKDE